MNRKPNIPQPEPAAKPEPNPQSEDERAQIERIVEEIVARQLEVLRRETEERIAQAHSEGRAEAERLAAMSDDERRRYEEDAARTREEQLMQREAELNRRELRAWLADELAARGLPRELGEIVDCADRADCEASLAKLEKLFREAVQRGVDERIGRGHSLPRSDGGTQPALYERLRAAAGLNSK